MTGDEPLRIAFVCRQYPPDWFGGIGTYNRTVATLLAAAGHDVTVIAQPADGVARSYEEDGVQVERVPSVGPRRLWTLAEKRPLHSTMSNVHAALNRARSVRGRGPFDVIEVPEWRGQSMAVPFAIDAPIVTHLHLSLEARDEWNDFEHGRTIDRRLAARMERWGAARAAARTTCSLRTLALPDGRTWLPPETVAVVAPPLDPAWLGGSTAGSTAWSTADGAGAATPSAGPAVILVGGHLEFRKGPDIAVAVTARLQHEVPGGVRLRFVGKSFSWQGRSGRDHVAEMAEAAGVDCEIRDPVVGIDAMRAEYERASVVIGPSRFEPLHLVPLEAMACGRPVVVSDRTGVAELLGDEVDGLVAPLDDIDAWVDRLLPLLTDPDRAAAHGAAGQAAVRRLCDPARVVADRERVYREAIASHR